MKLFASLVLISTLLYAADSSWKVYDDSAPARIDITVAPRHLQWLYQHTDSDSEFMALIHFRNKYLDKTVDSVGFSLRGNTSRKAAKQSFQISFNTFKPDGDFHGVEKLNLNGEHNDPSIIRSKLCFDLFRSVGVTASRAAHILVYINNRYYGLYISVEHVDEEFLKKRYQDPDGNLWKCLYPADLSYQGDSPDRYKYVKHDQATPAYDLKTNEKAADYTPLARLIKVLNKTPDSSLPDSMENIIDVTGLLKYFSINVLVGSWDDYRSLMNNYYLYHEPSLDRMHLIPYDYDNTFGVDWFGVDWSTADPYRFPQVAKGARPLVDRMLAITKYRDLFSHFLDYYSRQVFNLQLVESRIDSLKLGIAAAAAQDTFRTLDYGFTWQDFNDSYSTAHYANQHVKFGLKEFIQKRSSSIKNQLVWLTSKPLLYNYSQQPVHPGPGDSLHISLSAFSRIGIKRIEVKIDGSGAAIPMAYSPAPGSLRVEEADQYTAVVAPSSAGDIRFYMLATDQQDQTMRQPRSGYYTFRVPQAAIVINEIMADNQKTLASPAGDFADWIELYNPTRLSVLLTGMSLTDRKDNLKKWTIRPANLYLPPGGYLLIWCDEATDSLGLHANFKLDKSGEFVALVDTDGMTVLDSLSFGEQTTDVSWGRSPDAAHHWQFLAPTPLRQNTPITTVRVIVPTDPVILTAYPNPFNPVTTIRYRLSRQAFVHLTIFDVQGRTVAEESIGRQLPGAFEWTWQAKNKTGYKPASGIYWVRLQAGEEYRHLKILLLK